MQETSIHRLRFSPARLLGTAALLGLLALPACATREDSGGYTADVDFKDAIKPGTTTRDEIKQNFGSPSTQSSFGPETWFYITDRSETFAFLKPKIVEQDVTEIAFDSGGIASNVRQYTLKDGKKVSIASRTTPTEGHTLGFLEQTLGNIGRFNSGATDSAAPGRKVSPGSI